MRNMSNTFDKLSVLDSFIEEVNSYLPEIETNLERLAQSPGDMDALEETYRRSHTIGGSASMMDFPGLAHVAHGMEDILGDALDGLTTLDEPTLGLLRRSLARLHQLLEGIRNGVDEEAIIAEDDADYARYRAMMEASAQGQASSGALNGGQAPAGMMPSAMPSSFDMSTPTSSSMPSFDEVLASFRTPTVMPGEEVAWPEEPMPTAHFEVPAPPAPRAEQQLPPEPVQPPSSALDTLVASTRQAPAPFTPSSAPYTQEENEYSGNEYSTYAAADFQVPDAGEYAQSTQVAPWNAEQSAQVAPWNAEETRTTPLPSTYEDVQQETRALEAQASSLRSVVAQLRAATSVIEAQRSEFKGFLDGSKDALDRMEDWAGRAMGLNLRNSPEQVRRYLPLSVMWVANNKLKKVLDLLGQITGGIEFTNEQMGIMLQQLQVSLESLGEAFQQAQASHTLTHEPGWTPWEMQVARDADALRERVTFERRGDPVALRNELEAKVREELRREYEARPVTMATRAELEQQIRNEVRQEFEARQLLLERVSGPENDTTLQDLEARLRNDIEIQVRQEFLNQIMESGGDAAALLRAPIGRDAPAPVTSNFLDQAQEATRSASTSAATPPPSSSIPVPRTQPLPPRAPASPVPSARPPETKPAPAPAFSGDFGEEAAEIFRLEAEEHLQTISVHAAALEKAPTNRDLIQGIRRATHTLKGAAGMMGFRAIADLCHISEDLLDSIMEGATAISPPVLSLILDTAEILDVLITGRGTDTAADEARVQVLRARYTELLGDQSSTRSPVEEDIDVDAESADEVVADTGLVTGVVAGNQPVETNAQRASRGDLSVRVRLQKLDELVNLYGEQLVNRSVLEERIQRLVRLVADVGVSSNRLRDVGQKLESRFEAATLPSGHSVMVMPGEGDQSAVLESSKNGKNTPQPAHLSEFDELELDRYTEFHQLARGLSEGISDMATLSTEMEAVIRECESVFARENRLSTTFQDRLMKVRLVPLSTMTPRLYRAARAVALKQRKEFNFLLEGEETEVDRTVYEEIAGPLLHIMRNAVNHALETPDARIQKGKPPAGQIKLSAGYEGNQVVITVRDDGTGIDPEHVRNSAIAGGFIRPDQQLSEADIIELIFRPGFSTAEVLSEESGRGVGLDVVRDSVARLRGTLVVDSMPGQGTAFTMKFPTSLAIQSAMMVRVSGQQFAIPTVMVESIGRLDNFKRSMLAGQPAVLVHNDLYPLRMLAEYLSLPASTLDEKAQLLLVNTGGHRVALVVDEIKGKSDIVMKNLGPHLRNVYGIAGGTVLGNGRVVLILELSDLLAARSKAMANVIGATATPMRREFGMAPSSQTPVRQSIDLSSSRSSAGGMGSKTIPDRGKHILVVDDSPSVRRVVSNMLKQNGWEVQMARDGVEALEMISYETPAAVLLDIEMPRMDGYELIATVRAQEQYRTLPLVVLTSRAAAKHQQRAMQLGASAYVIKPYQDEELIGTLNSLVYGAAVR
jgi:chemotaxis protein histidine kinase CheA/ActR/RegA family two-component response regulator